MTVKPAPYALTIIGTVGVPASYGGFETLAEQLVRHLAHEYKILVVCSGKRAPPQDIRARTFSGADLEYVNLDANGWQSVPYDFISLWRGARRSKALLVLGVSGGLLLPIIRLFWPQTRIITNVDGVEWKRAKWGRVARTLLRASEWAAVRASHEVVADNQGICDHIQTHYGQSSHLIAYGGDNVASAPQSSEEIFDESHFEPGSYYFSVCRIEPENNIEMILEAFAKCPDKQLVIVGNWQSSAFAQDLHRRFAKSANMELKEPIYDQRRLRRLRCNAKAYIHGHSAGGTNPSLVEAMYAKMAVLAFDVDYNRYSTHNGAIYWHDAQMLAAHLKTVTDEKLSEMAEQMGQLAKKNYTWASIAERYNAIIPATSDHGQKK